MLAIAWRSSAEAVMFDVAAAMSRFKQVCLILKITHQSRDQFSGLTITANSLRIGRQVF